MVEKDCNTCRFHFQAEGNAFCIGCLTHEELPKWEPDLEPYLSAIDERHQDPKVTLGPGVSGLAFLPLSEPWLAVYPEDESKQSRKESLIEALLNTFSGFVLSYLTWVLIATPLFNIPVNHTESFLITCLFTVVSIARSYVWRRLFNNKFWRKASA